MFVRPFLYNIKNRQKIMKGRLQYVDSLRGFCIMLVVLGHVLQHYYSNENLLFRIIYSFHMPLFMFLSGYVSYRMSEYVKIGKRAVQLLVPFFSAILLGYVVGSLSGKDMGGLVHHIIQVVVRPDRGLWFLWALFFISVLFLAARKLANLMHLNEWIVMGGLAVALNGIELVTKTKMFGFHWISWYFLFFTAGAYWRMFTQKLHEGFEKKVWIFGLLLFLPAAFCFRLHNEPPLFYSIVNLGKAFPVFYRLLVGMLGIAFFYEMFKRYDNKIPAKRYLMLTGG